MDDPRNLAKRLTEKVQSGQWSCIVILPSDPVCASVFEVLPDRPISRSILRDANGQIDDHLTLTPVSVRGRDDDRIVVVGILDRWRHIAYFVGFHPRRLGGNSSISGARLNIRGTSFG